MNKVIRDGRVAVLVSPGFGPGWSLRAGELDERKLFCPELVHAIEAGIPKHQRYEVANAVFGEDEYLGGIEQVRIQWVDVGRQFTVTEHDGSESIDFLDEIQWVTP